MTDANPNLMRERRVTVTEAVFSRERRHSKRIRFFRRALPGLAVLILAVLVGRTAITSMTGGSIDLGGTTIEGGKLIMSNPRMSGFTAGNRPYELTAQRAIQDITKTESVDLEGIDARLPVGMENWADVDAATGTLHRSSSKLVITSPTLIRTTDGMEARLQSAELLMASGDIHASEHVEIESGGSHVTAEELTVTGGGSLMIFERNVKMLIEPKRLKTASAADGAENATK
jgi:lipopolysaccharide export system protein LptC